MATRELEVDGAASATGVASSTCAATSTRAAEAALAARLRRGGRGRRGAVVLNFAGVDYINSTGIALIVGLLAQARARGVADHARAGCRTTTARSSRSRGWPTS